MEDIELYNPQTGEKIAPKRPKKFYNDWRFYVYSLIALMLAIVSISSAVTACAAINAGVGQKGDASYSVAQRKNALITTDEGGYSGYRFSVSLSFPSTANTIEYSYYTFTDIQTYTLALTDTSSVSYSGDNTYLALCSAINGVYDDYDANQTSPGFLVVCGYGKYYDSQSDNECFTYFTFLNFNASSNSDSNISQNGFVMLDLYFRYSYSVSGNWRKTAQTRNDFLYLTLDKADCFYPSMGWPSIASVTFQDIVSYYKELGFQNGYSDGYSQGNSEGYAAGESAGYASGYSEGLEVGNSNGQANGYANGYAAGLNASNYFKSITANNDLVFFDILANITPYYTDGNGNLYYYRIFSAEVGEDFYYCWLCYYSTSNWTAWDVYLVWCDQSSSSGFTLDYLKNNSLGVWAVPKSNGAFSSVQSYAVYEPSIKTLDNAKVSLVYNVQMMQAYVTLDGGRTYGDVYKDGYTTGYQNGYNYGYELGETAGINAADPEALTTTLVAVFQQPFNQIYRFFNFNILGLNILGLATGLLSVFIIIKVFKKVLK